MNMTRFVYLADTHIGAMPMGFQMQSGYPERIAEIVSALRDWIIDDGHIDFVLHGGDMVDSCSDTNIERAADVFNLPVPVYLCLGNHDLTRPGAVETWMRLAPCFFPEGRAGYSLESDDYLFDKAFVQGRQEDRQFRSA